MKIDLGVPDERPDSERILSVSPNEAIDWGYNLYLAETLREGSVTRRSALKALEEIEAMVDTFKPGGRERQYLTMLRMAANSFGQGVERRQRHRAERIKNAKEQKEEALKRATRDTRRGGLLAAGFKMMLMGGFIFLAVKVIFGVKMMSQEVHSGDSHYLSLCTALGIALFGAFIKGWFANRRMVGIFSDYDTKLEAAQERYAKEVVTEYEFAAQTANTAWKLLTDQPAPVPQGFEDLLLTVIRGYHPDAAGTELTESVPPA